MLCLVALILLSTGQIVLRDVFSTGVVWADGLTRLIVLWLALLGAIAASRDCRHIAIDVVTRLLPPRLRVVASVVRNLFTSGVCGLLAWYSWTFVSDSREFGDELLGNLPAWWFQLILPVGFALIAYRYLLRALGSGREAG